MDRRDFLKKIIKAFFAIVGLSTLISIFYIYPPKIKSKRVEFFYLLDEEDLPRKGVKRVDFSYNSGDRKLNNRVFIAVTKDGLIALSPVCTHLGCLVNWDKNKGEFLCPCHGGKYDMEGVVKDGPPPAPLTRLPLEIKDGRVFVGIKV